MEEKKLELRLGPPGDDHTSALVSPGYYISSNNNSTGSTTTAACGTKRGLINTLGVKTEETRNWLTNSKFTVPTANTVAPKSSEERMAIDTVVGWPPIGSFRKNLSTSSSSKGGGILMKSTERDKIDSRDKRADNLDGNSLFVKIHMDGVPIGRKIDLKSYDNYEILSSAVDELFRCLLAAQKSHHYCAKVGEEGMVETKGMISTGLLDGSGEYTLVYEDNEGDRMLVGDDVPWHMFVSTAKRLRVLKRSELSSLQEMSLKSQSRLILLQKRHEEDKVNPN